MAKLKVFATASATLKSYELNIHGRPARDGDIVEIVGQTCGDESTQFAKYKIEGETGATLKLTLRCPQDGDPERIVLDEEVRIAPAEGTLWFKL